MELYNMHIRLASLVNAIVEKQKTYKDRISNIKNRQSAQWGKNYMEALENLRADLIPTKQTSIFADESRLREDITQVYVAICNNEAAPSNLQLSSINALQSRLEEAIKKFEAINQQYEEKLKRAL
jgi:hypothetical protein